MTVIFKNRIDKNNLEQIKPFKVKGHLLIGLVDEFSRSIDLSAPLAVMGSKLSVSISFRISFQVPAPDDLKCGVRPL